MRVLDTTPKQDGFYMPAEFSEHYGCILIFPERSDSWQYGAYAARKAFVKVCEAIAQSEKVTVCASDRQYENARRMLPAAYPCGGDVQQRQLGEGLRPDFCNKRSDYTRSKLELQRLGRS